jgi:hypothetical protein
MGFDLTVGVERDLQANAQAEHISPSEAVVKFVQSGLKSSNRKAQASGDLLTDELINPLKTLDSGFGLLEDVPEENIKRMEATIRRMKRKGFPERA